MEPDRRVFTFSIPPVPGNIYTPLWDAQINVNVEFGELNETTNRVEAVIADDGQAAPVSNLLNTLWKNKNTRINRLGINNGDQFNTQTSFIINKLTVPSGVRNTYQQTEGGFDETCDPDIFQGTFQDHQNVEFLQRQKLYCRSKDDTVKTPKTVSLTGKLNLINKIHQPLPSRVEIQLTLEKEKVELLVNSGFPNKKYSLNIVGLEIHIPRLTIDNNVHSQIENKLTKGEKISYYFNRIQTTSFLLPGATRDFEVKSLFPDYHIPPTIIVFFQSQKRYLGDLSLSPHKYEMVGGIASDDKPNLNTVSMKISGAPINRLISKSMIFLFLIYFTSRYFSTIQGNVESGMLKQYYLDLFRHLNCYYKQ